jgi:hypothetical protein
LKILVVVPTGNAEPEGNPAMSVALEGGVYTTTAEHTPGSLPWTILPGQVIDGGGLPVKLPSMRLARRLPGARNMQARTRRVHLVDLVKFILLFIAQDLLTNLNL